MYKNLSNNSISSIAFLSLGKKEGNKKKLLLLLFL